MPGDKLSILSAEEAVPASLALSSLHAMFRGAAQGLASWTAHSRTQSSTQPERSLQSYAAEMLQSLLQSRLEDAKGGR